MSLAIVYGSSMGNTENAAGIISEKLGVEADILNIADTDAATLNGYDKLICGSSTWGSGDLQDDWDVFDFSALDLSGKTVAIFGLGDSQSYSDEFCNAMAKLYHAFKNQGATIVGEVSTEGYTFDESEAVEDGNFIGLPLDCDNEDELTDERISNWIEKIKPYFS